MGCPGRVAEAPREANLPLTRSIAGGAGGAPAPSLGGAGAVR